MKMPKPKRRSVVRPPAARSFFFVLGLAALTLPSMVQGQTQTAQTVATPTGNVSSDQPKGKKIWTEDDLLALRRPWDILVDQQDLARQLAADAAERGDADPSTTQPAKLPSKLSDGSVLPSTPSDIQQKIEVVQREIVQLNADLDSTRQAYLDATQNERREKLKANIELLQDEIKENSADLATLQGRLQSLKAEQPGQPAKPGQDSDVPQSSSEPAAPRG